MRFSWSSILTPLSVLFFALSTLPSSALHQKRESRSDLEVRGVFAGLSQESTRYITHNELLSMAQLNFTVTDDSNFTGPTRIRGVKLEDLMHRVTAPSSADMVVAISDDGYRANYPPDYLAAHEPVLVLEVNGKAPAGWPKDSQEHKFDMGPYMISHEKFSPAFKILSHFDEAQIPWGVVRLDFRSEKIVFGAIAPRGPHAPDRPVQDGYSIAEQNCFRCHNAGREGGQKSGRSWESLGTLAASSPGAFKEYVRSPLSQNAEAKMPGNPQYDDATLAALTAYFATFSGTSHP
jgi:mono/diheme cytochrome c family protein